MTFPENSIRVPSRFRDGTRHAVKRVSEFVRRTGEPVAMHLGDYVDGAIVRTDDYVRRRDTLLAEMFTRASGGLKGKEFRQSHRLKVANTVIGMATLPVALPVIGVAAFAKYLEDLRGPFYKARREGPAGEFDLFKIRSMPPDADKDRAGNRANELASGISADTRATRFGRVLRATNIDESAQVGNILNGTLDVCGPRPYSQATVEVLKEHLGEEQAQEHMAKVTAGNGGLINSGRSFGDGTFSTRIRMDALTTREMDFGHGGYMTWRNFVNPRKARSRMRERAAKRSWLGQNKV